MEPRSPLTPLSVYKEAAAHTPGLDPIALYHNNAISQFARDYIAAQEKELGRYGLGMGRHIVLNLVNLAGEKGITPAELADRLGITRGAMTGLIDGLESAGFIVRENHPADRRMVRLVTTKKGQEKIAEYYPPHARTLCKFINTLTKAEQKQLVGLLNKLSTGFRHLAD